MDKLIDYVRMMEIGDDGGADDTVTVLSFGPIYDYQPDFARELFPAVSSGVSLPEKRNPSKFIRRIS